MHLFHPLSPVGAVSSQPRLLQPLQLPFLLYLDFLLPVPSGPQWLCSSLNSWSLAPPKPRYALPLQGVVVSWGTSLPCLPGKLQRGKMQSL